MRETITTRTDTPKQDQRLRPTLKYEIISGKKEFKRKREEKRKKRILEYKKQLKTQSIKLLNERTKKKSLLYELIPTHRRHSHTVRSTQEHHTAHTNSTPFDERKIHARYLFKYAKIRQHKDYYNLD